MKSFSDSPHPLWPLRRINLVLSPQRPSQFLPRSLCAAFTFLFGSFFNEFASLKIAVDLRLLHAQKSAGQPIQDFGEARSVANIAAQGGTRHVGYDSGSRLEDPEAKWTAKLLDRVTSPQMRSEKLRCSRDVLALREGAFVFLREHAEEQLWVVLWSIWIPEPLVEDVEPAACCNRYVETI